MVTPRQLRYFLEIAKTGSLSAAAASLHIAQPALSQHLASMEEELGAPLLERHARGVRLTPEGKRLVDRAGSILDQLTELKRGIHEPLGRPTGSVRLCVAGALASVLAAPLYRYVDEHLPEVRLLLSTAMSTEVRTAVETRQVDLALMPNAFELPNLTVRPLYEEDLLLFGLTRLFEGQSGPIRFAEIGTRPLVAPDRDHDLRRLIERTALAGACPLNVRYELNNPELSLALVRDGLAFAIMPRNVGVNIGTQSSSRSVRALEIVEPRLTRVQSVVSFSDHPLNSAGSAILESVRTVVRELIRVGTLKGTLC
ncbi:LysR family transcriptional regulator [Variovorax paradoxus]|nr:LysR family transcriptional regulator [Variovorax paradoxus]